MLFFPQSRNRSSMKIPEVLFSKEGQNREGLPGMGREEKRIASVCLREVSWSRHGGSKAGGLGPRESPG